MRARAFTQVSGDPRVEIQILSDVNFKVSSRLFLEHISPFSLFGQILISLLYKPRAFIIYDSEVTLKNMFKRI